MYINEAERAAERFGSILSAAVSKASKRALFPLSSPAMEEWERRTKAKKRSF